MYTAVLSQQLKVESFKNVLSKLNIQLSSLDMNRIVKKYTYTDYLGTIESRTQLVVRDNPAV